MPNSSKSVQINFRVPEEYKSEWDRWKGHAEQAGQEMRDWVFARVRQSLAPKPTKDAALADSAAIYRRGYYTGAMVGRLDWVFTEGIEHDIDPGEIKAWCQKHSECVSDVIAQLTMKPYGLRFHEWWQGLKMGSPG